MTPIQLQARVVALERSIAELTARIAELESTPTVKRSTTVRKPRKPAEPTPEHNAAVDAVVVDLRPHMSALVGRMTAGEVFRAAFGTQATTRDLRLVGAALRRMGYRQAKSGGRRPFVITATDDE